MDTVRCRLPFCTSRSIAPPLRASEIGRLISLPVKLRPLTATIDLPIGTLVKVQLLGVIEAEQTERGKTCRNDRSIGKVTQSHTYRDITSLEPLGEAFTDDLETFFRTYNGLRDRGFKVIATGDAARAAFLIVEAELAG